MFRAVCAESRSSNSTGIAEGAISRGHFKTTGGHSVTKRLGAKRGFGNRPRSHHVPQRGLNMFRLLSVALATSILLVTPLVAQQPRRSDTQPGAASGHKRVRAPNDAYAVPPGQMEHPAVAVRRNAQFRAAQRRRRIAARRWFGLSNSRPMASATPWMGAYSPYWMSNTGQPFGWAGVGRTTVIRSERTIYR